MALTIRHYRPYTPPPRKVVNDDSIYAAPFRVRGLVKSCGAKIILTPRKVALENGDKHYDGAPCRKCGSTRRYTASSDCIACQAEKNKLTRKRAALAAARPKMWEEVRAICSKYGVTVEEMMGRASTPELFQCRREAWSAMVQYGESYRSIGQQCSGRSHGTIRQAVGIAGKG